MGDDKFWNLVILEAVANLIRVNFTLVTHLILATRSLGVRKFGCYRLLL